MNWMGFAAVRLQLAFMARRVGGGVMCALLATLVGCGGQRSSSTQTLGLSLPSACQQAVADPLTGASPERDERTVARIWQEQALESVRRDFPRPTVHARNLFHISAALYDAWAAYDTHSSGYLFTEKAGTDTSDQARRMSMAYAAFHLQMHRTGLSFDSAQSRQRLLDQMRALGLNPCHVDTAGSGPAALGNRIAALYIEFGRSDGANEGEPGGSPYLDTSGWISSNPHLRVAETLDLQRHPFPDQFQLLEMAQATSQNGIATSNVQSYVTPHWGKVKPFALQRTSPAALYLDPGPLPAWNSAAMQEHLLDVIRRTDQIDPDPARDILINVSPSVMGNNSLGSNSGSGHAFNPATGQPYPESTLVSRSLWGRMLADYWADGPDSETPPGHWNLIANQVADDPLFSRRFENEDRLEWEVKTYFMLNAAMHDTAIAAWEVKRHYQSARPISLIRHRAALGQNSDPSAPSYHPDGLPLLPGLIELATEASLAGRHALSEAVPGQVLMRSQVTPTFGAFMLSSHIGWQAGDRWSPYQPANFVTPAFPGLVSGHSAFSRAAAEVLAVRTGSRFFPGGLHTFEVKKLKDLDVIPAEGERWQPMRLTGMPMFQMATYADAADMSGLSRLWGGIHIEPDDLQGRRMGQAVGWQAIRKATALWSTDLTSF